MASSSRRSSLTMDRTSQWVSTKAIPTDVVVEIGEAKFPLHKFMLVSMSGLMRRTIMESSATDLARIDLSDVPGGAEAFERAARFCYGVNFEITIHNVVALRCAAEYLEMTDRYSQGNLAGRTEEFLRKAALNSLPSAVVVLRSCESLLPLAEELKIVERCVDAISAKACKEATSPTRSPPDWWAFELASLGPSSLQRAISAMCLRGAPARSLATAVTAYAQKALPDLLLCGSSPPSSDAAAPALRSRQRHLLDCLVPLLPADAPLPVGFLCCLLRASIFLGADPHSRRQLEGRIAAILDLASVGDLLTISLDYYGDRIADLDSLRRIVAAFVRQEGRGGALYGGGSGHGGACCSAPMQKVAKTVDAFVGEIATDEDLTVSKFAGIAGIIPKVARRFDDDLYRAVDIYLKAHPGLDEIEREKACSVMDTLKLSYEARLHASQNKRLPLQVVVQAMYYDQLHLRGGGVDVAGGSEDGSFRGKNEATLQEENEALKLELTKMKVYLSELQRGRPETSGAAPQKGPGFFRSMSRTLGKLNPFNQASRDTSIIDERGEVPVKQPRRIRFSMS